MKQLEKQPSNNVEGGPKYYSKEELQKPDGEIPNDVDKLNKHLHLSPQDFEACFGMTIDEFNALAQRKQRIARQHHGLYV